MLTESEMAKTLQLQENFFEVSLIVANKKTKAMLSSFVQIFDYYWINYMKINVYCDIQRQKCTWSLNTNPNVNWCKLLFYKQKQKYLILRDSY